MTMMTCMGMICVCAAENDRSCEMNYSCHKHDLCGSST